MKGANTAVVDLQKTQREMSGTRLQVTAIHIRPPVSEKPTSQLDILLYLVIRPGAIKRGQLRLIAETETGGRCWANRRFGDVEKHLFA
jgi:hypothetical protein